MTDKSETREFGVDLNLTIHRDKTKHFTMAVIESTYHDGTPYVGVGMAKRAAGDADNPQLGMDLAIKRALIDLADNFSEY